MSLTAEEKVQLERAAERITSITMNKLSIEATLEAEPEHPRAADYRARLDDYADGLVRWETVYKTLTIKAKEKE